MTERTTIMSGLIYMPLQVTAACFFILVSLVTAQDDSDEIDVGASQIPARPLTQILDAAQWFTPAEKEEAQKELNRLFTENNVDIYLVTRSKQPPQGAKTYARILGETWSRAPVWCVVFHVPGEPTGFHVEAGGVEVSYRRIEGAIAEAVKRARREHTEKERVMAAWKESSELIRYVYASGQRYNEQVVAAKDKIRSNQVSKEKLYKAIAIAGAVALVLFSLLVFGFIRFIRRRRFRYEFPETVWRTRYQGPYSGGSGIEVSFRRKRIKAER